MYERIIKNSSRKLFFCLLLLLSLYVLPIILADRLYRDDVSRALIGAGGWNKDGRPLTELLLWLLNFGRPLADLFPLPLLISVLLLAGTFTLYLGSKLEKKELSLSLLFAAFLPAASPFFIPNLSYRYDSVTMTLSLCLPFIAFAVPLEKRLQRFCLDFFVLLCVWCLFQPSASVYFALIFLELFFDIGKGRFEAGKLFTEAAAFISSAVIYLVFIAPAFVDSEGWRAEASKLGLSPALLAGNIRKVFSIWEVFFSGLTKPVLLTGAAFFLLSWCLLVLKSPDRRFPARLYTFFLPFLLTAAAVAPLLVLSHMKTSEHMLAGMAVPLLLIGIGGVKADENRYLKTAASVLILILMLWQFQYISAYGNAMKSQKEYELYLACSMAKDLDEADPAEEVRYLTFEGTPPRAPECTMLTEKYPAFGETVPVSFENDDWLGAPLLYRFLQRELYCVDSEDASWKELKAEKRNALYTLFIDKDHAWFIFSR
ncbi:MAG: glucosyltransferase domain-containing protein [Lachnospiraceae bacterium]|nr:glucosyltransferase domain-containing protein [Lachnospiraceae bacterium]